jgi:hypothetical protein
MRYVWLETWAKVPIEEQIDHLDDVAGREQDGMVKVQVFSE